MNKGRRRQWRRPGTEFGGTEHCFADPRFLDEVFSGKLFLVIGQVFLIFRIFTVLNVVYDPLSTRKSTISEKNSFMTPFLYFFRIFALISDNTTSQNIGGKDAWAVPPPQILGGPSPSPPRSPPLVGGDKMEVNWVGNGVERRIDSRGRQAYIVRW